MILIFFNIYVSYFNWDKNEKIPFNIFLLIIFYKKLTNETHIFIFYSFVLKDRLLRPGLGVLYEMMLWLMKSISQFFLFGKPKSCGAFAPDFWEPGVLSRALMGCFSKLTCALQNLKD